MEDLQYTWGLEPSISFAGIGVVGNPAIATDSALNIYFAAAVQGTNPTAGNTTSSNIAVGSISPNGVLLWYQFFPELLVATNQSQVSLVIGVNQDLYVAFTTPGSTPQNTNMSAVPIFCPCLNAGPLDVVVARINIIQTIPKVAWVIQNARINSCSNEYNSKVAIDTQFGLLYIVLQTGGSVNCNVPVGAPNLLLSCFTLGGQQLWLETQTAINGTGANTNPAIVTDNQGNLYLAYETTATIQGGAPIATQQVEMVKFQTTLAPSGQTAMYSRTWVLSGINGGDIFSVAGVSSSPVLAFNNNLIFLGFLTTGSVDGAIPTGSEHDLVMCAITPAGIVSWIRQGSMFNQLPYFYLDAAQPYVTTDNLGNVLVSLLTYSAIPTAGNQNIFIFKLNQSTGINMYEDGAFPIAYTGAPSAAFPTGPAGSFSALAFTATNTYLNMVLGTHIPLSGKSRTSSGFDLVVMNYIMYTAYPNISPFTFMTTNKKICVCGGACVCLAAT